MAVMNFDDLCTSLCSLAGVAAPSLEPDENGLVGFTLNRDGVDIGFVQGESGGEPGMLMIVDFGTPKDGSKQEVLRELLETNFLISGVGAPAFVRNPFTGAIALHQSCLLSQAHVEELYQVSVRASDAAIRWKDGELRDLSAVHALAPMPGAVPMLFG